MKHLIFIVFLVSLSACLTASAETITFNVGYENAEQPPYYMGQNEVLPTNPGVAVELVQLLETQIPGLKVKLYRYPWIRCTQYLENGHLDGIFNASFKVERLHIGRYPWKSGKIDDNKRITTISYALYALEGSPVTWDGTTIQNLMGKIGAPRGYSIVSDLQKKGYEVEEVNTSKQIIMMLQNGRLAAGAMQLVTADKLIKSDQAQTTPIHRIDPPLAEKPYYLMISHQFYQRHPEMTEKIWSAIEELRNRHFDEISSKYVGE